MNLDDYLDTLWIPFMRAAQRGDTQTMADLSGHPALSINDPDLMSGARALHVAARAGATASVQWLLAAGALPNLTNAKGQTPADVARACGHEDIAALLQSGRQGQQKPPPCP